VTPLDAIADDQFHSGAATRRWSVVTLVLALMMAACSGDDGRDATVSVDFSTADPSGAAPSVLEYVVGPDSIPACRARAVITFRVDGSPTVEFFENRGKPPRQFNLTQQ
jgi:hypothetical protein